MPDVRNWLEGLKLGGYYQTFIENRIDSDVLPYLTEADLEKLRIPLGDRKRLMRGIRALSSQDRVDQTDAKAAPATAVAGTSQIRATGSDARVHSEQLRPLTLMFVDLVDSTKLSEQLDLEDFWETITGYQLCCSDIIRSFHGFVARYLGDGVLAYFGYPRAAENDAERAVAAGLEIARAVGRIENKQGMELEARVGIATGRVLISDLVKGHLEIKDTALGNTPNLAARLQALAEPGTVVISEPTRNLLGSHVDCVHVGSLALKGFSEPVSVWQVKNIRYAASRFEARQKGPMTPLAGRDEELALLLNRWRSAAKGDGRVALVSGEAGIGKSRLVQSLCEYMKGEPHIRLRYQCSPFHTRSTLYPIVTQLAHAAGLNERDEAQEKLDKIEDLLRQAVDDVQSVAPLIASLLSVPDEGRYRPLDESAETIKEATKLALLEQCFGLAEKKPVVAIFEDVHWIDPSTEELLGALIEQIEARRILILCTYRPEYEDRWTGQAGVTTIHLNRLDHRQSLEMIRMLRGGQSMLPEMAEAIAGRTEGVPLFIEELTKSVLEAPGQDAEGEVGRLDGNSAALTLPTTLSELLMAKLDSLSGTDEIIQICAAIGRTFSFRLLAKISGLPDSQLQEILEKLTRAQVLVQRGRWPDATYSFRHALIQETAYATMLRSRVKSLHAHIAGTLVNQSPEYAARSPEVVAHHYSRAAMSKEARDFWTLAGDLAIARSAYLEAIAHLEAALRENAKLDDEEDRTANEIALREKLVIPLEARFWGSDDIAANLNRLHELQERYGDDKDRFAVLHGLYGTHVISGKADLALGYASKMMEIAQSRNDATFSLMSHHAMGMSHFAMANFEAAIDHYASAIALRTRASPDTIKQYYLADMDIVDQCMQAWAAALNGAEDVTDRALERASSMTESAEHEFSRAYGFSILASVYQSRGNAAACLEYAARALELSQAHKFRYWQSWARIMQGWALAVSGDINRGIDELTEGLDSYGQTGSKQIIPYAKTLLADAYLRAGRLTSSRALIEEVRAVDQNSSVRFHRLITDRVAAELSVLSEDGRDAAAGSGVSG